MGLNTPAHRHSTLRRPTKCSINPMPLPSVSTEHRTARHCTALHCTQLTTPLRHPSEHDMPALATQTLTVRVPHPTPPHNPNLQRQSACSYSSASMAI